VVGPPKLKRALWAAGATLAAAIITALALHGQRPDGSLVRFEPAGVMRSIAPDTVTEIAIARGARRWRFERAGARAWTAVAGPPVSESLTRDLDRGLRFLHASAPQRVLGADEVGGAALAEFGLAPPRYAVSVRAAGLPPFEIEFGGSNPQGLAQYARVLGRPDVVLLPSFVGASWESVMDER
jgi:hypothetical protein